MLHLDRNHHPSPHSKQNLILPHSWNIPQDDQVDFLSDIVQPDLHHTTPPADIVPGPITPVDASGPVQSHSSSPASPADGNSNSPTRDRSSSLSPAPETGTPHTLRSSPPAALEKEAVTKEDEEEEPRVEKSSRHSTPLSELSPPPDEPDNPPPDENIKAGVEDVLPTSTSSPKDPQPSEPLTAPSPAHSPSIPSTSDPKVVSILELNTELLSVCMEFQNRGIPTTDGRFHQYSQRLQSNLAWLAAAYDRTQGNQSNMVLPLMDPPPPVDFTPMSRIQQGYAKLPLIFAKEITRRQQMGMFGNKAPMNTNVNTSQHLPNHIQNSTQNPTLTQNHTLKRDRPDDGIASPMGVSKRRDMGDSKTPSMMMPPPSLPMTLNPNPQGSFPLLLPNHSPVLGEPPTNHGLVNAVDAQLAASNRERARQAQIRMAHQQQQQQQQQQLHTARQMSPSSSGGSMQQQSGHGSAVNTTAGPSNLSNSSSMNANVQQSLHILQTPGHPFVQYMTQLVPGFQTLPTQTQVQKMLMAQNALQNRQQEQQNHQNQIAAAQHQQQQRNAGVPQMGISGGGSGGGNGMQGNQFVGQGASPVSPVSHQSQMAQVSQNPMFPMGNQGQMNGMDPRAQQQQNGNGNGPGGMNTNGLTRQQMLMLQQQQHAQRNMAGNPGMMMTPQQQMAYVQQQQQQQQQQDRMRQEQQRLAHVGSPTQPGPDGFPALRSNVNVNPTIPGIARSARSPSDSVSSPMTPRVPTRGPSLGQEDYQRMMIQQQQNQAARSMAGQSPVYNQSQQMVAASNWQQGQNQQSQQQQQGMQMHGQGSSYGMSPPGSAGVGGAPYNNAPSPSNSQNWSQGTYPFSPSPNTTSHQSDHLQNMRHMSATPNPQGQQQQQQMIQPQNANSPGEQTIPNDFDLFNWAQ